LTQVVDVYHVKLNEQTNGYNISESDISSLLLQINRVSSRTSDYI